MNITIVGAGPRGLAVALYAIYKKHQVTLIDPSPLHTWSSDYLLSDLEMRSPITFDLTTFIEELQDFSLSRYLGLDILFSTNQGTIEGSKIKVTRYQFCNYLNYVYNHLKQNCTVIESRVIETIRDTVYLENGEVILGDAVVFCLGYQGKPNIPLWLKGTNLLTKKIDIPSILNSPNSYKQKKWLVVGSGQGAAEITHYLTTLKGDVYWAKQKDYKVNQYPAPNYQQWGTKSALGNYYRNLFNYQEKLDYLGKVKQWQPSITPYIAEKLKQVNYKSIEITSYKDIVETDYIVLAAGVTPTINTIPTSITVPTNPYLSNFPELNNFKIKLLNCNWYISGILTTAYDGPRQHSLISAGLTAKEIIEDIERGNN